MLFTVNTEVCTRCGLCVTECPTGLMVMTDDGPKAGKGGCVSCGHCVAVCPKKALDSDITPRLKQIDISGKAKFTPEQAELFLRSRRSIRSYQDKPVPTELIEKVLNVARMAPTATNTQGISYIVIRNKETLKRIADLVLEWMHLAGKTVPIMRLYSRVAQAEVDKGKPYILRDAPVLVIATGSKKDIHRTHDSGHSCLSYAELYAPSVGLGSCWAGFFEHAGEAEYAPLLELLQLPDDKIIAGAILMGYPKFNYRNIVERSPLEVTFDEE